MTARESRSVRRVQQQCRVWQSDERTGASTHDPVRRLVSSHNMIAYWHAETGPLIPGSRTSSGRMPPLERAEEGLRGPRSVMLSRRPWGVNKAIKVDCAQTIMQLPGGQPIKRFTVLEHRSHIALHEGTHWLKRPGPLCSRSCIAAHVWGKAYARSMLFNHHMLFHLNTVSLGDRASRTGQAKLEIHICCQRQTSGQI